MELALLPADEKAERKILGVLLQRDYEESSDILGVLEVADFFTEPHRLIFSAIVASVSKKSPLNPDAIEEFLEKKGTIQKIKSRDLGSGREYLYALTELASAFDDCTVFSRKIKEAARKRRLILLHEKSQQKLLSGECSSEEILSLMQATADYVGGQLKDETLKAVVDDCKKDTLKNVQEKHEKLFKSGGVRTGFHKLDNTISIVPASLNIVQAPTGQGKTAMMVNLLCHFLNGRYNSDRIDCVFVTYETSKLVVQERIINALSLLSNRGTLFNRRFLGAGELYNPNTPYFTYESAPDVESFWDGFVSGLRLRVLENIHFDSLQTLVSLCKRPDRPMVLFLDYIQKVNHSFKGQGWENMKSVAYGLETIAKEKEIIIIAGSQVTVKENMVLDPREGADIAHAAQNIITLIDRSHPRYRRNDAIKAEKIDGAHVVSLEISKGRAGLLTVWDDYLLLDRGVFKENPHGRE